MSELISGKEALIALANGEGVEYRNAKGWSILTSMAVNLILNDNFVFRIKPRTITLNGVEIPSPFEPKNGEMFFYLYGHSSDGFDCQYKTEGNSNYTQFGVWRTEEEIKQVVDALREVFK